MGSSAARLNRHRGARKEEAPGVGCAGLLEVIMPG
jgi:hypothetical protein